MMKKKKKKRKKGKGVRKLNKRKKEEGVRRRNSKKKRKKKERKKGVDGGKNEKTEGRDMAQESLTTYSVAYQTPREVFDSLKQKENRR